MTGHRNKKYDHDLIHEMNRQGKTAQEIGEVVGAPAWYIRQILLKSGEVKSKVSIDKGKIRALNRAGWTIDEICSDMHIPESDVTEVSDRNR